MEALVGKVWVAELWNVAIVAKIGEGASALISLDNGPFSSERVPMSWEISHVLVLWFCGGDKTSVLGTTRGQSSLFYPQFSCMTCGFGLLSLKSIQCLVGNRARPV